MQLNLRSVAEDVISNKQKTTKRIYQNGEGTDIINSHANISEQVITLSDIYSACENKYHVMKTSSAVRTREKEATIFKTACVVFYKKGET